MEGIRAKGTALLGIVRAIQQRHGEGARRETVAHTQTALRQALEYGQIVPIGWYPAAWYADLLAAARTSLGGDERIPWQLSYAASRDDFSGAFSIIVRLLTVEALFRHSARLMMLYWKGGTVEAESASKKGRLRFRGWKGFDQNIWMDLQGGVASIIDLRGARNLELRVASGGRDGCDDMDLLAKWR
jgi:hypothetical protein